MKELDAGGLDGFGGGIRRDLLGVGGSGLDGMEEEEDAGFWQWKGWISGFSLAGDCTRKEGLSRQRRMCF